MNVILEGAHIQVGKPVYLEMELTPIGQCHRNIY